MNELHDLLDDLSRPGHDRPADPYALLAEGRRRVRHRRLRTGAAGGALALAVVSVAGVRLHEAQPERLRVATPPSYADLDLTPLSVTEVEARCAAPLRQNQVDGGYTISAGTPHQAPRPWHVGSSVLAVPDDGSGPTSCTVPESTSPLTPLSATDDPARLRTICGDDLGIDLSGWQTLAAGADGGVEVGLYRSGNGYLADCQAENTPRMGVQGDVGILREADWRGYAACTPTATAGIHCLGAGRVADHTATRVAITLPSGRVVERPATEGYWAVAVRDDASSPGSTDPTFAATPVA